MSEKQIQELIEKNTYGRVLTEWDRRRIEQQKSLTKKFQGLILPSSLIKIEADYSGENDDGQINEVRYLNQNGDKIEVGPEINDTVESYVWSLIPAGFENNEGGSGTVIIDLKTKKAKVNHKVNEVITHDQNAEYDI